MLISVPLHKIKQIYRPRYSFQIIEMKNNVENFGYRYNI